MFVLVNNTVLFDFGLQKKIKKDNLQNYVFLFPKQKVYKTNIFYENFFCQIEPCNANF